jgi:hypothetical protein
MNRKNRQRSIGRAGLIGQQMREDRMQLPAGRAARGQMQFDGADGRTDELAMARIELLRS